MTQLLSSELAVSAGSRHDRVRTTAQVLETFTRSCLRAQLAARRWQRPARGVIVMHNGPLLDDQRAWVALLSCAEGAALAGLSSLAFDGFAGFEANPSKQQVVLPEGAPRPSYPMVVPHWSTRLDRTTSTR